MPPLSSRPVDAPRTPEGCDELKSVKFGRNLAIAIWDGQEVSGVFAGNASGKRAGRSRNLSKTPGIS